MRKRNRLAVKWNCRTWFNCNLNRITISSCSSLAAEQNMQKPILNHQSINQSINQSIKSIKSINQINQSINQINQSIKSINQSINQSNTINKNTMKIKTIDTYYTKVNYCKRLVFDSIKRAWMHLYCWNLSRMVLCSRHLTLYLQGNGS